MGGCCTKYVRSKSIHHTIVDEGASTYIMSISCWKAIGSPQLNQLLTTLKAFDGRGFKPYRTLILLQVELASNMVLVEVEFIEGLLDYNLLLGCTCVYDMDTVVSTYFKMIAFPNKRGIVAID